MKSVNKWIGLGNVGKDPEVKYLPNGTAVATFSLACNERFKDKSGEWADRVEWINCKAWAKTAEIVGEYVKKGQKLYVEGRINTESWEKDGKKNYKTVVVVSEVVLLGVDRQDEGRPSRAPRHMSDEEVARSTEITDEDVPF